jgi:hypothetical protein
MKLTSRKKALNFPSLASIAPAPGAIEINHHKTDLESSNHHWKVQFLQLSPPARTTGITAESRVNTNAFMLETSG